MTTTAALPEAATGDGAIPKRAEAEARQLILAALNLISAELNAALQFRYLSTASNQHGAVGWEAYMNAPPNGAVWVAFLADTVADDPPFLRENQRFMPHA